MAIVGLLFLAGVVIAIAATAGWLRRHWQSLRWSPKLDHTRAALRRGGAVEDPDASALAALRHWVLQLPRRDRVALLLIYADALTLAEVGEVLGMAETDVEQLYRTMLDRARQVAKEG